MDSAAPDWNVLLVDQLDWHWRNQLRPRLDGLTDDEYLWEPVPDCWSVRPRGSGRAPIEAGTGEFRLDLAWPPPDPGPVTTIAWRLGHVITGVLGARTASHFGGPPVDLAGRDFPFSGTADGALAQLDAAYAAWRDGVRGLGAEGLARPCGPREGPYAKEPLAALVLHINREVIHHGAETALLRDLYRARHVAPGGGALPD
ncbi:DinB family protein [Streptomyces sp. NPDC008238]